MRVRHQRAAQALGVTVESDGEFWGWAGRTLGAPARTAADAPVWLRLVAEREEKASGKLWTGAVDAQRAFGDLDGHRPALVGLYDETEDGTAYRAELSVRVGAPVLSTTPVLGQDLGLPATWWAELAETLHRLAMSAPTDRIAIRPQCMARAIPQFVGIPAPEVTSWAPAHGDLH
ncbi:hypothetical protein [Streptomyces sp. NPDC093223]|uniref:hypothetical protein n=1 Tax=Streptomyces sp. NPDC093223 TaxID=3366033 RepID=UPI003812E6ED